MTARSCLHGRKSLAAWAFGIACVARLFGVHDKGLTCCFIGMQRLRFARSKGPCVNRANATKSLW